MTAPLPAPPLSLLLLCTVATALPQPLRSAARRMQIPTNRTVPSQLHPSKPPPTLDADDSDSLLEQYDSNGDSALDRAELSHVLSLLMPTSGPQNWTVPQPQAEAEVVVLNECYLLGGQPMFPSATAWLLAAEVQKCEPNYFTLAFAATMIVAVLAAFCVPQGCACNRVSESGTASEMARLQPPPEGQMASVPKSSEFRVDTGALTGMRGFAAFHVAFNHHITHMDGKRLGVLCRRSLLFQIWRGDKI
eukprot:SAG31_NODE_1807_length_7230_cov_4.804885_8_plen_248_part_00